MIMCIPPCDCADCSCPQPVRDTDEVIDWRKSLATQRLRIESLADRICDYPADWSLTQRLQMALWDKGMVLGVRADVAREDGEPSGPNAA